MMVLRLVIAWLAMAVVVNAMATQNAGQQATQEQTNPVQRFQVASVDFSHVSTPFIISLWIVIAGLAKIGFHVAPKLSSICPESCLLIVVGVIIGILLYYTNVNRVGPLTPDIFFLFLLPPIVLDAGYYMPNRLFFDNLITILLYAVVGTVFNAVTVGVSIYGVGLTGLYGVKMPFLDSLLFSSIASAVDPVAVLAVFEEIHVNEVLYILVFGESLLNDAVTVVLYRLFDNYNKMGAGNIILIDYVAGVSAFFVAAICGTLIGVIWGFVAAFISRFTHHVRVIEPVFVFAMSYLAYVNAELFRLSSILSLTFCGITMKNYVEENISNKSHVTVKYSIKMLASCCETIIFLFLGVSTVNDKHEWNTWFVVCTIFFCTLYRAIGVVLLTMLANHFRIHQLNKVEQFIMAYGGLRGAVAFALALIVSDTVSTKNMMVTTIIALIYFTVFVQGMTIGPLVRVLHVKTSNKTKPTMNERIHTRLIDHLMAGIEDVSGQIMGNYHIRDKFKYYNNKYLRPLLISNHQIVEPKIIETYSKLNLADAMNMVKKNCSAVTGENNSLSMLFRTYTQANFQGTSFNYGEMNLYNAVQQNDVGALNVDMGELNYCPSTKDLADAEIHHILSDSMFHPPRRLRKYSRDDIPENGNHPPFQHNLRMQIRRLVSEQRHRRKRSQLRHHHSPKSNNNNNNSISYHYSVGVTNPSFTNDKEQKPEIVLPKRESNCSLSSDSTATHGQEDEGIIFQVTHVSSPDTESDKNTSEGAKSPKISQTITESTLPWKRQDVAETTCAVRQQEFPSWIENKEYMPYTSPTNTLLGKLDNSSERKPAVFEIFQFDSSPSKGGVSKKEKADSSTNCSSEPNSYSQVPSSLSLPTNLQQSSDNQRINSSGNINKETYSATHDEKETVINIFNDIEQHTKL